MPWLFFCITVKVLIFQTLFFLFSNKMLLFSTGIHKMHVRIANREDPDQTASSEGLPVCLNIYCITTSVQNFRIFTEALINPQCVDY